MSVLNVIISASQCFLKCSLLMFVFSDSGMSGGAVAGIVIGVLLGTALIVFVIISALGYFGIMYIGPFKRRDLGETTRLA